MQNQKTYMHTVISHTHTEIIDRTQKL